MHFQNPWGALGFVLIPVLVILYLLKQRYQEKKVPSTYLWQIAANQWEASHPWQKWKKNLLFFMQMLILLLLIFSFMQPVWETQGIGGNTVVVVDLSLSMQAQEKGITRLNAAKEEISIMIEDMPRGGEMSIVVAGAQNELLAMKSSNKTELKSQVEKLVPKYSSSAVTEAVQLAKSVQSDDESEVIYVFTDQDMQINDDKVVVRNLAQGAPNVAIGSLSYAQNSANNTISVLGLVRNYSKAESAEVELWCDGELLDVKEVSFGEEALANVIFEDIDPGVSRIMLAISEEDALIADNYAYCTVQNDKSYKVLLQTEQNVFLEKAILLREDIELYKSNPSEELPLEEYDLIIGDSWEKEELPENQDIWLINPVADNDWIELETAEVQSVSVSSAELAQSLFAHVDMGAAGFAEIQGIAGKSPADLPLVYSGTSVLVMAQAGEKGKRLAFGFDLHESSLPMMKDFPIMVQNILSWYMPQKGNMTTSVTADQPMPVTLGKETDNYTVTLPDGTQTRAQRQPQFAETENPGFYNILQHGDDGETLSETGFAVNPESGEAESNLYTAGVADESQNESAASQFQRSGFLLPLLSVLALLFMLIEWWVYHRGR